MLDASVQELRKQYRYKPLRAEVNCTSITGCSVWLSVYGGREEPVLYLHTGVEGSQTIIVDDYWTTNGDATLGVLDQLFGRVDTDTCHLTIELKLKLKKNEQETKHKQKQSKLQALDTVKDIVGGPPGCEVLLGHLRDFLAHVYTSRIPRQPTKTTDLCGTFYIYIS